ncbi:rod shape-determining protein RodA [Derxia gummosa]|uniref:Peptidoglycan glycosyltransferase MrdB n=1 Tax=Derxia gummosa DSM 723 TaxID=1121388 RepID=A0A8B6X264_9BURK|nr:rod shape-determining protein RodA [Derxia gummosa]
MTRRELWLRIRPWVMVFDPTLLIILGVLVTLSLVTMASSANNFPGRFDGHVKNLLFAFCVMWVMANVPPRLLMRAAVPIYVAAVTLLIAVALFGTVKKGARRWIDLGFMQLQPSEFLKIGLPLMLAWYFHMREATLGWKDFALAAVLMLIPVGLILKQPDLGTATLVAVGGFSVIFFAGLSWKVLAALGIGGLASLPLAWTFMHDYQRERVLTLLDPTKDPLGKGFHIIQSTIAIGSGGIFGKGWMQGTQTHLEFIPERTTDFIFSVYSEEFGFVGNCLLLVVYFLLLARGLIIAGNAPTLFARLFSGAIVLILFMYAFVNMGMVSGILPVVGVPLPFMSYGGTALMTLAVGCGVLMSVNRHRQLVQS